MIKFLLKRTFFILGVVLVSPLILLDWIGYIFGGHRSKIFCGCAELLSICPSYIGIILRKAYYWAVCTDVSPDVHFLFGSMLSHRENVIRSGVVVGHYTLIGFADIGENVQLGPRVSIISGKYQHGRPDQRGDEEEAEPEHVVIKIGKNSWIGQDVVIMANIGENSTVGAGSVVYKDVPDNTTVLGNPARKVSMDAIQKK